MRVLGIGAHPDDLEIACAGTLIRYAQEGHAVTMCNVCSGSIGHNTYSSEELVEVRLREGREAAEIGGARHVSLRVPDGEINASNVDHLRLVVDALRDAKPDLIITHSKGDYMRDHDQVSELVFHASLLATLPLFKTELPAYGDRVPPIYFMQTIPSGLGFHPTEYVDITDVLETKAAMLAAHRCQVEWSEKIGDYNMVDEMRVNARFRGYQCGVLFAEGFVPCLTSFRGTTTRLLPG